MALTTIEKAEIVKKFQRKEGDTGSSEVQVAILTAEIKALTEHLKAFKKDNHSRYGLQQKVNQRRKLLAYLKRTGLNRYLALIKELGLRH